MAAAFAAHKRPAAADEACPTDEAGKKRARHQSETLEGTSYGVAAEARGRRTGEEMVAVKRIRGGGEGGDGGSTPSLPAAGGEAVISRLAACREHPVQYKHVATFPTTGELAVRVTELVVSPSLRSRLTRPFSEDETRGSMRQLLRAAEEMHAAGTVHGDINPGSIPVSPDGGGALKIRGFGRPWTVRSVGDKATSPEEDPVLRTLRYRSPEQLIRSGGCHGPEVDMWALGCLMAELLTGGEPLFTATTEDDMITQVVDLHDDVVTMGVEAFDGMLELSVAGREILAGLLAFHSEERLTAADALKHRWFADEDVEAKPPAAAVEAELPGFVPSSSEA